MFCELGIDGDGSDLNLDGVCDVPFAGEFFCWPILTSNEDTTTICL